MNTHLLALWINVIFSILGVILLAAFLITGRKNAALRISGGVCILIGTLAFAYWRFLT